MDLAKTFLEEIDNPDLSVNERASLRCRVARHREAAGDFDAAREAMAELWQGIGVRPVLEGKCFNVSAHSRDGLGVLVRSKARRKWQRT